MKNENAPLEVSLLQSMSAKQYREYLRSQELMYLDVRGLLRLTHDDSPLAVTAEQVDVLIEELRQFKAQMATT